MIRGLIGGSALLLLMACDEEPGPTVMTLTSETDVLEIGVNQLSKLSINKDQGNGASLTFRMDPEIASAFSEMTAANIGKTIAIAVCGEVVSEPIVQDQISGGMAQISGYTTEEFEVYLDRLKGREPC